MRLITAKEILVGDTVRLLDRGTQAFEVLSVNVKPIGRMVIGLHIHTHSVCSRSVIWVDEGETFLLLNRPWDQEKTFAGWVSDVEILLPNAQAAVTNFQDFRRAYHVSMGATATADALRPLYEKLDEYFSVGKSD